MKFIRDGVVVRENKRWVTVFTWMAVLLALIAGCSPAAVQPEGVTPSPPAIDTPVSPTLQAEPIQPQETSTPTEAEAMGIPDSDPTFTSSLRNLIEKAREDLAKRLSISVSQINLVDAKAVVWPDSSLGCPQPGMAYADVITPGYLIILNADDKEYEYHASRGSLVIYCENPTPPIPGLPEDI